MLQDLKTWNTLISAAYMHRPHSFIALESETDEQLFAQQLNLKASLACAALNVVNSKSASVSEADLFE